MINNNNWKSLTRQAFSWATKSKVLCKFNIPLHRFDKIYRRSFVLYELILPTPFFGYCKPPFSLLHLSITLFYLVHFQYYFYLFFLLLLFLLLLQKLDPKLNHVDVDLSVNKKWKKFQMISKLQKMCNIADVTCY